MKRRSAAIVLILLCSFSFSRAGADEGNREKETPGDPPVKAESIKQLYHLIASSINDDSRLEKIQKANLDLVRNNQHLTMQYVYTLLHEGVKKELAGVIDEGLRYYAVAKVLAKTYNEACGNNFLLETVALFLNWDKKEKEKYFKAMEDFSRGKGALQRYDYDTASRLFRESAAGSRKIKYKSHEADCLLRLGEVHRALSENEEARRNYNEALAIYRGKKDGLGVANCLQSLGDVHRVLDENKEAQSRYFEALAIYRGIKDRLGAANCLHRLGNVHRTLDENEEARSRYSEALDIYKKIKAKMGVADCLRSLGEVHRKLDENEEARSHYSEALAIYRAIKDTQAMANCLKNLGDVHRVLFENKEALRRYSEALAIYRGTRNRPSVANCLIGLGEVHRTLDENEEARRRYSEALAIYRDIKNKLGEANCLICLGDVHRIRKQYEKSAGHYHDALAIQLKIPDINGQIYTYYGKAKLCEDLNRFEKAEENYKHCIRAIETIWNRLKVETSKRPYLSSKVFPYRELTRLLFQQGKGAKAFHYAERSKARTFLYLMGNKHIDFRKGVPQNLFQEERRLKRTLTALSQQSANRSSPELTVKLLAARKQYRDVTDQIKRVSPANPLPVAPDSTKEIQRLIRKTGILLIEYYTTPDTLYMWLLDGKRIIPYKIDIAQKDLDEKVDRYRTMLVNTNSGTALLQEKAQDLYDLLIKPMEAHLTNQKPIAVVPHGTLHYLPFCALMNQGKFLVQQGYKFFYLPSASTYKYCRQKNTGQKTQLAAFGNPDGSLKYSETEVNLLQEFFPANKILTRKDATESKAKDLAKNCDILHLSCHGRYVPRDPLSSALLLFADAENNGDLEVEEIYALQMKPAYLVTLSACQTNMGGIYGGDDIVGFSRAFIYAGASAVMTSLWSVSDYYTNSLMIRFYRRLQKMGKMEALHKARLAMIRDGLDHPCHWAGFVLIGDPK
ncbi:MAG: CHAT domain-containing protein [bacterium]|nr:CHAT domain-containing protein [bacterium]